MDKNTKIENGNERLNYFYITNQFGPKIKAFLCKQFKYIFNLVSIYEMAIKLLDFLEIAHTAGYVHNDIGHDTVNLGQG